MATSSFDPAGAFVPLAPTGTLEFRPAGSRAAPTPNPDPVPPKPVVDQDAIERRLRVEQSQMLERLASQLAAERDRSAQHVAEAVVGLALTVANRVVRQSLEADDEALVRIVRGVLEDLGQTTVCLRLHREDARILSENAELLEELGIVELREDPSVERYGFWVESGDRQWDARLRTQMDQLREALEAAVHPS